MGEPLIGSLVCGAMALGMMWWNWQMMEAQRRKGRKVAIEAAKAARVRAQIRADARAKVAAAAPPPGIVTAASPLKHHRALSSSSLYTLEPLPECPVNTPIDDQSPLVIKAVRDRLETAPLSPPSCSPRAAEAGFFQEG